LCVYSFLERFTNEKNVPAIKTKTRKQARIPPPYGFQGRKKSPEQSPQKRKKASHRVRNNLSITIPIDHLNFRLSKTSRISSRAEISYIIKAGCRWNGRLFSIVSMQNSRPKSRLAVLVSRKYGNAVERNRAKRRLRELFRLSAKQLLIPVDILFIPKPGIRLLSSMLIQEFLEWKKQKESY
jgi:ribonuclease P protein component